MKKLILLIVLFVFISGYTLLAQTIVITGTVTSSAQGEVLVLCNCNCERYYCWGNNRCEWEILNYSATECHNPFLYIGMKNRKL